MNWDREKIAAYYELSKPRLSAMAVIMVGLGYVLARRVLNEGFDWPRFFATALGTSLVGIGSAALNQWIEVARDAAMDRTKSRPLPSGRLERKSVLYFGYAASLGGVLLLLLFVNPVTAVLAAFTLFFYLAVYTPAKPLSSLATLIGAIPGAIPPLMGWTAGYGMIAWQGLFLFGILFLWQIPHFLAIAWMYKDDYALGDFAVLPVEDPEGSSTFQQAALYSLALLVISVLPTLRGMAGTLYFGGALFFGGMMLQKVWQLSRERSRARARGLFLVSILYLPAISILLVLDQIY
ncbi:MAG: heme o synthase [Bdellovibrionales bacterium]|nr:heme o synthase [Bdellovibrionales bacterium]